MRALTLTQPWCGLVASGIKLVENRPTRVINPRYLGQRFALHASGEIDEEIYDRIYELAGELLHRASQDEDVGAQSFRLAPDYDSAWYRLSRITGSVIAVATVVHMMRPPDRITPDQQRWFFGPVGYVLSDVVALVEPVRCPGKQWFWELPAELEARVLAQIPRAA